MRQSAKGLRKESRAEQRERERERESTEREEVIRTFAMLLAS